MKIPFTKMHGLGNDFMIINGIELSFRPSSEQICHWSNRHTGIGFDQLLLVEPARHHYADFFYRIFNADGTEVAQCGNGARCIARFLHDHKLTLKNPIHVETIVSTLELTLNNDGQVTVDMGLPQFLPDQIPFVAAKPALQYELPLQDQTLEISALSIGNPHCVLLSTSVEKAPVDELGRAISNHPFFPEKTNVEFMQVLNPHHIRLRVFERGAGETLACGSGACAAVVAGQRLGLLESSVHVDQPGGRLTVLWQGENNPVFLTGPTATVYHGTIDSHFGISNY